MAIDFQDQRRIFIGELTKVFDYIELEGVINAKQRMYDAGEVLNDDIPTFIQFASYAGSLIRIAYYKYVHKQGFDVRALADAAVQVYMFNDVYRFEFQDYLRRKEVRQAINKTRWPAWTRVGLIGESTRRVIDLGEEFCAYMDGLDEEEATG